MFMKRFLVLIFVCALSCGCLFTPQKDNSRFYALGLGPSRDAKECLPIGDECKVLCLNVESVPPYVDVSQIIKLRNGCEITRSEIHRWAEPVKYSVFRSLSNHLRDALGNEYIIVSPFESGVGKACEYKICVSLANFIFNEDTKEMLLAAKVSIFKHEDLVALCNYSNRFNVGTAEHKSVINSMDWALKMLGEFVARCVNIGCLPQSECHCCDSTDEALTCYVQRMQDHENMDTMDAKIDRATNFPRIINISAHGEVYVVVDSEDGTRRYFSGRLFNGSSVDVKCDLPYKITSTNDELVEVR
jgi:uncharacterized lipoprotein YmbA